MEPEGAVVFLWGVFLLPVYSRNDKLSCICRNFILRLLQERA